ncbi:MAG: sodium:calcium symporter [Candidatus Riflebacteria bacterium]|nr:sodium:calcium symporter [Candidatus Riflebacteria bacterium]
MTDIKAESTPQKREHWGSRIGLILAMAGNAVGLGNFLRFPAKAAANGGGAFMIPYFCAFLLLGIPLMWVEWGIGRFGGVKGHGTTPGMFHKLVKGRWGKYFGVLGIILPLFMVIYYNYIESWTLSFSYFSMTGAYQNIEGKDLAEKRVEMTRFFREYHSITPSAKLLKNTPPEQIEKIRNSFETKDIPKEIIYDPDKHGKWDLANHKLNPADCPYIEVSVKGKYFNGRNVAYLFFFITFLANFFFVYKGVSGGIEKLGKIGMPILFGFAIILAIRVLTLGQPAGSKFSVADGMSFLWSPDFSQLTCASVWLAAAGQIFFTLSVGSGAIHTYASYLSDKDDIALTGISTSSLNEFAEVILGGSIAIPAAVAYFGPEMTKEIARSGAFDLGFQSMPMIFNQIQFGTFFGTIWFGLLFIAGITSSVALLLPAIAYLKDELGWKHSKATITVMFGQFIFGCAVVLFFKNGFLDEMDYWAGTFGLVIFAFIEIVYFMWLKDSEDSWKEMHKGADIEIPRIFYYIIKYVTPLYITLLIFAWGVQDGWPILTMQNVPVTDRPYIWGCRLAMLLVAAIFVHLVWVRFGKDEKEPYLIPAAIYCCPLVVLMASYPGLFPIETNGLLFITVSWITVLGMTVFSIYSLLTVPVKCHDDFPDEVEEAGKQ